MSSLLGSPMIIGVRTFPRVSLLVSWGMTMALLVVGWVSTVQGCRIDPAQPSSPNLFRHHVVGSCSLEDRAALALPGKSLFEALKAGKSVDLQGVVVTGDVELEELPQQPTDQVKIPFSRSPTNA